MLEIQGLGGDDMQDSGTYMGHAAANVTNLPHVIIGDSLVIRLSSMAIVQGCTVVATTVRNGG